MILDRDGCKALTDRVLARSHADETEVSVESSRRTHLRFARSEVTTSGSAEDLTVSVTAWVGTRSGSATVNQDDDASLDELVRRAEELAELSPEDPEHMPVLGPQAFPDVPSYSDETEEAVAAAMADGAAAAIAAAGDLVGAGFVNHRASSSALASSAGLFGFQRDSRGSFSTTVRTGDGKGSGWAAQRALRVADIDFRALAARATDLAARSAGATALEPGEYTAILTGDCVAAMISLLNWNLDARGADEGRSFFSKAGGGNRIGEKLFSDLFTLTSDPMSTVAPGSAWGESGQPQAARTWFENGVLRTLSCGRFWAQKTAREAVPWASNSLMKGGDGTLDDLVARTERGVLVNSFWYIRGTDPQQMAFTGLTRDGVFLVENGKVTRPVNNFRWNDGPGHVFAAMDAMGASARVAGREAWGSSIAAPPIRVPGFRFTSVSDAV